MKLGIVTYATRHLKTEQLVHRLLARNRAGAAPAFEIVLCALPFVGRPEREVRITHRPDQSRGAETRALAAAHGLEYAPCTYDALPGGCEYYLVAGAGILSPAAIRGRKILNAHPGIIPAVRGLDAFKWSLLDSVPLGVTLHYVDEHVDAGEIVAIERTPIYRGDTIQALARRHYELEIDVLTGFLAYLREPAPLTLRLPTRPARRRMPARTEALLLERFDNYVETFAAA